VIFHCNDNSSLIIPDTHATSFFLSSSQVLILSKVLFTPPRVKGLKGSSHFPALALFPRWDHLMARWDKEKDNSQLSPAPQFQPITSVSVFLTAAVTGDFKESVKPQGPSPPGSCGKTNCSLPVDPREEGTGKEEELGGFEWRLIKKHFEDALKELNSKRVSRMCANPAQILLFEPSSSESGVPFGKILKCFLL